MKELKRIWKVKPMPKEEAERFIKDLIKRYRRKRRDDKHIEPLILKSECSAVW